MLEASKKAKIRKMAHGERAPVFQINAMKRWAEILDMRFIDFLNLEFCQRIEWLDDKGNLHVDHVFFREKVNNKSL